MQIRKVGAYVYDVFCGVGHEGWSRVRRFHWGFKVVAGARMPREQHQAVVAKLILHPNGGIENV